MMVFVGILLMRRDMIATRSKVIMMRGPMMADVYSRKVDVRYLLKGSMLREFIELKVIKFVVSWL